MHIAFVIGHLGAGGAERAVTNLANSWAEEHTIHIITLVKSEPFYRLNDKISLHFCLEKSKTDSSILRSTKDGILRIYRLRQIIKSNNISILVGFLTASNIYTIWSAKTMGIPCIISERSNHESNPLSRKLKVLRNLSYPKASRLVVQTMGNEKFYKKHTPKVKTSIIPNGISDNFDPEHNSILQRENIILNVSGFREGKAQDILLRAFEKLKATNWRLVFLGDGPTLEKHKNIASKLNIYHRVSFEGAKKNVLDYYNKAGIFVFTSEHEGFPNALLEALYSGVPSISTNCPHGPADMITHGKNGFLVPVGSVQELVKKINQLITSYSLRENFSQNAMKSTKKYEMKMVADQWMLLVHEVIKEANKEKNNRVFHVG